MFQEKIRYLYVLIRAVKEKTHPKLTGYEYDQGSFLVPITVSSDPCSHAGTQDLSFFWLCHSIRIPKPSTEPTRLG